MTVKNLKNAAISIRQKLLNKANAENRTFNEVLQYYCMERFLYRLSVSPHADKFILKGALMLRVWQAPEIRPTMDIDMLGRTGSDLENITALVREICELDIADGDGLVFDGKQIAGEQITEDAGYPGLRIRIPAMLDTAVLKVQMDIGFGDAVYPEPQKYLFPVLLNSPVPSLLCYSRESAIAEKFEAMLKRGKLNSRMKDFYDVWLLAGQYDFDGSQLCAAVRWTLERRNVNLPEQITAFSDEFIEYKRVQWNAFRKKLKNVSAPEHFAEPVAMIKDFLTPVIETLSTGKPMPKHWQASGPWQY